MHNEQHSSIADKVLSQVRTGNVRMRSRAYFIARVALFVAVAACVLILSVGIASFIFFSIHESGELFLLGLGAHGAQTFFALFPWALFALDIALIVLLDWLLQGFKIGYRTSLLTLFFYVLAGSVALGFVFAVLPVHPALLEKADRGELPFLGELYEGIHSSHHEQGVFRGIVVASNGATSTIMRDDGDKDGDDATHDIITVPTTQLDAPLLPGDRVYILGTDTGGAVRADGIRHFPRQ